MSRIKLIVLALICCGNISFAAPAYQNKVKTSNKISKEGEVTVSVVNQPSQDLIERRRNFERAEDIIRILQLELIIQSGDLNSGSVGYALMLDKTSDPEVANRLFNLALAENNLPLALAALNKWQQIEPTHSPTLKLAKWKMDLLQNKPEAWNNLPDSFNGLNEGEATNIFYVLTGFAETRFTTIQKDYKTLARIGKKYPNSPEVALCLATYAVYARDAGGGIKYLEELARLAPEPSKEVQYLLALFQSKQPDVLLSFFKAKRNQLPLEWRQYELSALSSAGRDEDAYNLAKSMATEEGVPASVYLQTGFLAQKMGDSPKEAFDYYEKAYRLGGPTQDRAAFLAGVAAYDGKDKDNALKYLNMVSEPTLVFDRNLFLAWLAIDDKNVSLAKKLMNDAKHTNSKSGLFGMDDLKSVQLAIYRLEKKHKQYVSLLTEMITDEKDADKKDLLVLERAYYYLDTVGDADKAISDLRGLAEKAPNNPDYLNSLGYTLLSIKGNEEEGYHFIKKAYDIEPDSPAINDSLGWALYKLNKPAEALPYLEFAYKGFANAEVAAHLGEVLWQLGRQDDAREMWLKGAEDDASDKILLETKKRFGIR